MNSKYSSLPYQDELENHSLHTFNSMEDLEGGRSLMDNPLNPLPPKRNLLRRKSSVNSFWSPFQWFEDNETKPSVQRESSFRDSNNRKFVRIIDRNQELFAQSAGKTYLAKRMNYMNRFSFYKMDWFHSLIHSSTSRILLILMTSYVLLVALFAVFYYVIATNVVNQCNLEFNSYHDAFMFSLETFATIGYGAPTGDIFFDGCESVTVVLTIQCCLRILADSISIGVLYSRFARPTSRASTIIFSDKAVIRRIRGRLYFMFQLCELRKHQLVEAHIRLYVVKREVDPSIYFEDLEQQRLRSQSHSQMIQQNVPNVQSPGHPSTNAHIFVQSCTMRLNHPNDELGAMLLLMLPQVVVHEIDISSPLMPPPLWITSRGEVIRWNPPVYRALRRRKADYGTPTKNSNQSLANNTNTNKKNGSIYRDEFAPSENIFSEDPESYDQYDVEAVSNIEFPSVTRRGVEIYGNTPPPPPHEPTTKRSTSVLQSGVNDNLLVESIRNLQLQQHQNKATVDFESPGLQKFEADLNAGSTMNGTGSPTGNNSRDSFSIPPNIDFFQEKSSAVPPQSTSYYHFDDSLLNHPSNTPAPPVKHPVPPSPKRKQSSEPEEYDEDNDEPEWQVEEKLMVIKYLYDRKVEIIAVVEGTDATTGGNLQARHSYTCDDIEWDKTFANCIFPGDDETGGGMLIDFDYFHELRDAPKDAAYPGPIASCI